MIRSLLVANRGEIARRIFRTARRLGIHSVAVFSEADRQSPHVREADESVFIGPAPARESYLDIERVIAAAVTAGVDAVHPGYGFLAESAEFAEACAAAGLLFIGPPAQVMRAMASKLAAKARMRAAGVPVLPGYEGERQDLEHLQREALSLGLPLMIKPAAGGGGKAMRVIHDAEELSAALAGARRLAESTFGDGRLLLERHLASARHIEVQVFADTHGNLVQLGDRDCSIQRRHQKLIEEAPAPGLSSANRIRLHADALSVARNSGYLGAGTVEFLFDGRQHYFIEMNTRLQVEHTVTESVSGIDLVGWQLRVAEGRDLPLAQADILLRGHAIEARVCAEDPERQFLPSPGLLQRLEWPERQHLRIDAGFGTGDRIPPHYDSLIAKVIAWAPSRPQAAQALAAALEATECSGVRSNLQWLSRVLRSATFLENRHHAGSLPRLTD